MGFFQLLDPMYWLIVGPTMLFAVLAQVWVRSAFAKWSRVATSRGMTGQDVARQVLATGDARDVRIEMSQGMLSDHYDPRNKVLRLSAANYEGRSVAAAAIAAHEAGHALQTLPVEFDASFRARRVLLDSGLIVGNEETRGVNAVLTAAAMTYVAAAAQAVATLLYYVMLVSGRRD